MDDRSSPAGEAQVPEVADLYLATIAPVEEGGVCKPARHVTATHGMLHLITAWNPSDLRPTNEENERANAALRAGLIARGFDPLSALWSDPNSHHAEASGAVTGVDAAAACALGAKYGQLGVLRIPMTGRPCSTASRSGGSSGGCEGRLCPRAALRLGGPR